MRRRDLLRWSGYLVVAGLVGCRPSSGSTGAATAAAAGRAAEPPPPPPPTSGPLLPRDGIEPGEFDHLAASDEDTAEETAEGTADEHADPDEGGAQDAEEAEPPEADEAAPDGEDEADPEEPPTEEAASEEAEENGESGDTGPTKVEVLCREALGLEPARSGGPSHRIDRLTLHHTAVALGANRNAPGRLRSHQSFHLEQGWVDIAYHFGVDANGNVYELREPAVAGETFTEYDPAGHFLVVCEGDYDVEAPSDAMLQATAEILAYGSVRHGAAPNTLTGHRDHASITCPGSNLYVRLGELRDEVTRLAQGTLDRHERCGSDGRDRIRAIEAG